MCAICGFMASQEGYRATTTEGIAAMFAASEKRGKDAAGFAASVNGQLFRYRKDVSSSQIIPRVTTLLVDEAKTWIGHCRMATQGSEKVEQNNHPFMRNGLALIHNGIIYNYDEYTEKRSPKLEGGCDSELIIQSIAYHHKQRKSVTQSIQHMARELDGDMACALISRAGHLWLWRREEYASHHYASTPLEIATRPQVQAIHFASTRQCLEQSLSVKQSWDFSRLGDKEGVHFWLQGGELKHSLFEMPECENPTTRYYRGYWQENYNPKQSWEKESWCQDCEEFIVAKSTHVCRTDMPTQPFCLIRSPIGKTYHVVYPQYQKNKEEILYTCETDGCEAVLVHDELIPHKVEKGHWQYKEEMF